LKYGQYDLSVGETFINNAAVTPAKAESHCLTATVDSESLLQLWTNVTSGRQTRARQLIAEEQSEHQNVHGRLIKVKYFPGQ
jgi:hypothetical protein